MYDSRGEPESTLQPPCTNSRTDLRGLEDSKVPGCTASANLRRTCLEVLSTLLADYLQLFSSMKYIINKSPSNLQVLGTSRRASRKLCEVTLDNKRTRLSDAALGSTANGLLNGYLFE